MVVKIECTWCGSKYEEYTSRISEDKNNFCSTDCRDSYFGRNQSEENCSWCGEELSVSPSLTNQMGDYPIDNHFCDKSCESMWKSEHWVMEDHPSWLGGHAENYGQNWNEERRNALDSSEYKCELCGQTREEHYDKYGFDLDVHHRIPVRAFDSVENANFQNNLVVCCRNCHQSKLEDNPIPHNDIRAPA